MADSLVLENPKTATTTERTWPAALLLLFLASITAEMLTGSTPVLVFLTNPVSLIGNVLLYGLGALLIREGAFHRNLGWAGVLCLGAAYGIFEEGLVINTWANPWSEPVCTMANGVGNGLCDYSRVAGINLLWALELTTFHAIVSITIPILLVSLVFPARSERPWLGRKALIACVLGELLVLLAGIVLNIAVYRQHDQAGPLLLPYLLEIVLMIVAVVAALKLPMGTRTPDTRPTPNLWTLRLLSCIYMAYVIISPGISKGANIPFPIALAVNAAILLAAIWRVTTWSRRVGWDNRHILALASGALGFFLLIWDPIMEFIGQAGGKPTRGTILVALAYLVFLAVLTRRISRINGESESIVH